MLAVMSSAPAEAPANEIAALHQAARRYCTEQYARWSKAYMAQRKRGPAPYSDEDYDLFPRYLVLGGILAEIERWVPEDFATLEEAKELLIEMARTGSSELSRHVKHPIGLAAQAQVRVAAERFLRDSTLADWLSVAPLPFRRTLGKAEVAELQATFQRRWGRWYAGGRLSPEPATLPPHVTLHTEALNKLPLARELAAFLTRRGITRIFFVPEDGGGYEYDLGDEDFETGSETVWMLCDADWMIYASHESSITLGGAELLAELRAQLPSLDGFEYRGWGDHPSHRADWPGRAK